MHRNSLLLIGILCSVAVLAQVTFTGDAKFDFQRIRLSADAAKAYLRIQNGPSNLGAYGNALRQCLNGRFSGWDVDAVYMQYDYFRDVLYVGVDCFSTCGDPDGDGLPDQLINADDGLWGTVLSYTSGNCTLAQAQALLGNRTANNDPTTLISEDFKNFAGVETFSLIFWPEPPLNAEDYRNLGNLTQASRVFYPSFVVGVPDASDFTQTAYKVFTQLDAYVFLEDRRCRNLTQPFTTPLCLNAHSDLIQSPSNGYGPRVAQATQQATLPASRVNPWFGRTIPPITRFANMRPEFPPCVGDCYDLPVMYPNISMPDIEFSMANFSRYYNFTFQPGIEPIRFAFMLYMGRTGDRFGEEIVFPSLFSIPCTIQDACGVCNGDNSTCKDCLGVIFGEASHDACGVCNGNNACLDCAGIPNGRTTYDSCGVCNGTDACLDCFGVPYGGRQYDACGVCDGLNACIDCTGTIGGTARYDSCGVCNGNNACFDCLGVRGGTARYDQCGVCGGSDACVDCTGTVRGTASYDRCGVCNGRDECLDCLGNVNGTARYDLCGVCGGSNACVDCAGTVRGTATYDQCGVCNGRDACVDCAGEPRGTSVYDSCGVCGGSNDCLDCLGIPYGTATYDVCGVCNGRNDTCLDCAGVLGGKAVLDACNVCNGNNECVDCLGVPNGNNRYDLCGVCNGRNDTCTDCAGVPGGNAVFDACGDCGGAGIRCLDCLGTPNGTAQYDQCGVCDGGCVTGTIILEADEDAAVDFADREATLGRQQDLEVRSNRSRTVVQFDNVRQRLLRCKTLQVVNASLEFFIRGVVQQPADGWADAGLDLHTLNRSFCEKTVSWNCRDQDETGCCVPWNLMSKSHDDLVDYNPTPLATRNIQPFQQGWLTYDVTEQLLAFRNSTENSLSYMLKKNCENDWGLIKFWSCEGKRCPRLVVNVVSTCPVATVKPPCDDIQ